MKNVFFRLIDIYHCEVVTYILNWNNCRFYIRTQYAIYFYVSKQTYLIDGIPKEISCGIQGDVIESINQRRNSEFDDGAPVLFGKK